jgi:hypothetical protein
VLKYKQKGGDYLSPSTIDEAVNYLSPWTIVSGIIGILGFIISAINIIHYFISRRVNLEIRIKAYGVRSAAGGKERVFVHYQIDNKSQLPVSVTDMQLVIGDDVYTEDSNTHEILSFKHTQGKELLTYQPTFNSHVPISLACLSSHSDYLAFVIPPNILKNGEKALTFRIRTNRGKETQRSFALNEVVTLR